MHVSTKVGHYRRYGEIGGDWWDFGADSVRRSVDASLKRLGVTTIDTVFLHDCDDHVDAAAREAYPILRQLQQEGVIGAIGAGCNQAHTLEALLDRVELDTVMVAGRYTLLDQSAAETLFPRCQERKVRVIMAAPFNSGILATGSAAAQTRFDYQPPDAALRARVRAIEDICQSHGASLKAVALQFAASHPTVSQLMLGFIDVAGLQSNLSDLTTPLPEGLWGDLQSAGCDRGLWGVGMNIDAHIHIWNQSHGEEFIACKQFPVLTGCEFLTDGMAGMLQETGSAKAVLVHGPASDRHTDYCLERGDAEPIAYSASSAGSTPVHLDAVQRIDALGHAIARSEVCA